MEASFAVTDKERLARIEAILTNLIDSQNRLERSILDQISRLEKRMDDVETSVDNVLSQDGDTYRKLKYRVIEFIILAALGVVIGYLAKA